MGSALMWKGLLRVPLPSARTPLFAARSGCRHCTAAPKPGAAKEPKHPNDTAWVGKSTSSENSVFSWAGPWVVSGGLFAVWMWYDREQAKKVVSKATVISDEDIQKMNQSKQRNLEALDRAKGTKENMGITKLIEPPK